MKSGPRKPVFYASEVAALLGRHRYRTKEQALLKSVAATPLGKSVAQSDAVVARALARLQQDRLAMQEVELLKSTVDALCADKALGASQAALQDLQVKVQESASVLQAKAVATERAAESAEQTTKSETQIAHQKAQAAAEQARAELLKAEMPELQAPAVTEALDAEARGEASEEQMQIVQSAHKAVPRLRETVEKARKRVIEEAEPELVRLEQSSKRARSEAVKAQALHSTLAHIADTPAVLEQLVAQEVQKKRGAQEEQAVLQGAEAAHKTEISNRNERRGCYDHEAFRIVGYCDGFMEAENRVIEVKKRRNWFRAPPEYDVVQLRVYMRMFGAASGLLVESQMNGPLHRETLIEDAEEDWALICNGLAAVALEIQQASPATLHAWALCTETSA